MKEQLIKFVADIVSVSPEDIQADPSSFGINAPGTWDSLAHLAIMTELEDMLGVELSISEIEEMDNMQKIIERAEG